MTDLYETLGVERDADDAEITRAFRKKAKRSHPDAGGRVTDFQALVRAKDVLTDPLRRRKYDEKGVIDDEAGDPLETKAVELVSQALASIVMANDDILTIDMMGSLRATLEKPAAEQRAKIAAEVAKLDRSEKRLKSLEGRFAKRTEEGRHVLDMLVGGHLELVARRRAEVEKLQDELLPYTRALAILKEYGFRGEEPKPTAEYDPYRATMGAARFSFQIRP